MTKPQEGEKSRMPSAEGLARAARKVAPRGPAPVHLWDPPHCGALDIRIARDGTWFYLGTPIGRPELVRLFASILRRDEVRDGGEYVLVTPIEKVAIRVDDAPFVAVDFTEQDGRLTFTTNVGDEVTAGPDHPIRVERDARTGEPAPYLHVRGGLEALIDRKSFYRLVDIGEHASHDGQSWFGLRSDGAFFPMIPSDELEEH